MTDFVYDRAVMRKTINATDVDWTTHFLLTDGPNGTAEGFVLPRASKRLSNLIQGMLDDESSAGQEPLIPANDFQEGIMYIVSKYMAYYGEHPALEPTKFSRPFTEDKIDASPFEEAFVKEYFPADSDDLSNILGVMNVGNYLQVTSLLDLCCVTLVLRMKGKTPEQLKGMFKGQTLPTLAALTMKPTGQ